MPKAWFTFPKSRRSGLTKFPAPCKKAISCRLWSKKLTKKAESICPLRPPTRVSPRKKASSPAPVWEAVAVLEEASVPKVAGQKEGEGTKIPTPPQGGGLSPLSLGEGAMGVRKTLLKFRNQECENNLRS